MHSESRNIKPFIIVIFLKLERDYSICVIDVLVLEHLPSSIPYEYCFVKLNEIKLTVILNISIQALRVLLFDKTANFPRRVTLIVNEINYFYTSTSSFCYYTHARFTHYSS